MANNTHHSPLITHHPVPLGPGRKVIGGGEPVICVPLVAKTLGEALEQIRRLASTEPDLIEVRLDYIEDLTPEMTGKLLAELHEACPIPLLATFRRYEEKGARPLAEAERVKILQAALESGAIRLLDIELRTSEEARRSLLESARRAEVATVISYHDFEATPPLEELKALLKEMADTGAGIVKLAVYPRTPPDTLNLLAATYEAATTYLDRPLITMSMGALGGFTRLAGPFFGSALSFAVGENSSAPGQLAIDIMRNLWHNWDVL